jgi:superfamily I DNA/RNA helicase
MANLSSLNPQQRQAAETIHGPVLILAGAGTGKTRVITYRIAHLIDKGVAPENILAVTFTNKAAREMQERVNKLLPRIQKPEFRSQKDGNENRPTICTFHSLCVRILRSHIERLGYKRNFVIYDASEQLAAVKKILSHISAKGEKTDPAAVLALLSKFKNQVGQASSLSSSETNANTTGKMPVPLFGDPNVRALAQHIRTRYESALRACNAVDFDDLILLALRLFNEFPDVLESCRAKYRYVMADEYQDTNATQFALIHALTLKHRNLCVVGDDDQSIYGWRGAEIANLLDLEKHYPEVKIVKLEQNYRSTNTILTAANALIKNNTRRRAKQLWSQKGQGTKIILRACANEDEEATEIVGQIEFARLAHRISWKENAILFRTNIQSRPIETALRQAKVRYHLIGGQSFFDRREIRDFLAYLKTFINPHDDISLLRIANTPARGLSDVTMERLLAASQERKGSVFAAMKNPLVQAEFQKRTQESIAAFVEFIERTRSFLGGASVLTSRLAGTLAPPAQILLQTWADKFLDESGYLHELRRQEKDPEAGDARVRNLRELTATLDGYNPTGKALFERLEEFLENITLDSDREDEEDKGDVVTLITMHSCKGLEFPRVFIVGLEDGLLPHARSTVEGTLDEERRLFYVGVTRAMLTLTISHCASRKKYGQLLPCHPSRFLKELPPELVEAAEAKEKKPVSETVGKSLFDAMREAVG